MPKSRDFEFSTARTQFQLLR